MPYEFFFSYARNDCSKYLERFLEKLRERVAFLTIRSKEEVGFRDNQNIDVASRWPDELADALASCRSFIPVFTPTYFTRPMCGREWSVFQSRIEQHLSAHPDRIPGLVLPVLWCAPRHLPSDLRPEIRQIQFTHEDFGELYCKEGLLYLMQRPQQCKRQIVDFVDRFAETLIAATKLWNLPTSRRYALNEVDSYFESKTTVPHRAHSDGSGDSSGAARLCAGELRVPAAGAAENLSPETNPAEDGGVRTSKSTAARGPRCAQFIFVAATRDEFSAVSQPRDLAAYEDQVAFWKPFLPPQEDAIYAVVTHTACRLKMMPSQIELDADIDLLIEQARKEETILVIVIDPWSLLLPRYAGIMRRCDRVDAYNYAILVAWNRQDAQTNNHAQVLMSTLRESFVNKWSNRPANFYHDTVDSLESFNSALMHALSRAQNNILEARGFVREVAGNGPSKLPIVSA
jgi:FxsC-like protein